MKLIFQDEKRILDEPSVDVIIETINEWLSQEYYFSYFIVNGTPIYDEPETYLDDQLENIDTLEIIGRTSKELKNDLLLSAEHYIERSIPELSTLSEQFYGTTNQETWNQFGDMLEGIQWLNQLITSIDELKIQPNNWNEYLTIAATLENELKNLEEALQNKDHVLIGDIIQYEIEPIYQSLQHEVKHSIDKEGMRHDIN